jgi:hypothetical protein
MAARVPADVLTPLRRFCVLPEWLAAAADPERVREALAP